LATPSSLRRRLVADLGSRGLVSSEPVRRAFLAVPREAFLPGRPPKEVYRDVAIPTRFDAQGFPSSSSSQPAIMAAMLERLDVRPGQRVLEIGAGTGYNAALLKELVGPAGRVVSIELDPQVAREARSALRGTGHRVRVVNGDGRQGWPAAAPYDRIVVTASAAEVPRAWLDQLVEGGLVELPLRLASGVQMIPTLQRRGRELRSVTVVAGGFMPLRGSVDEPVSPPPSVTASEHVDGGGQALVSLFGASLARLSAGARCRVLALALAPPRVRRLGRREPSGALTVFVAAAAPAARLVSSFPRVAPVGPGGRTLALPRVGLVGPGGRSLALLGGDWDRGLDRIEACGEPDAERALLALVEAWRAAGRPPESALDVRVAFPRASWAGVPSVRSRSSGARSTGARARRNGSRAVRRGARRAPTP
jgi:protein-L-isoaspartate(D-aspartate) O-methyltransferase